jgi:hypothetical protein
MQLGAIHPDNQLKPISATDLDFSGLEKRIDDLESQQKMLIYALIAIVVIYLITKK